MTAAREGRGRIAGQAGPLAGAGSAAACLRASTATTFRGAAARPERRGHPGDHLRGWHPPVQQSVSSLLCKLGQSLSFCYCG